MTNDQPDIKEEDVDLLNVICRVQVINHQQFGGDEHERSGDKGRGGDSSGDHIWLNPILKSQNWQIKLILFFKFYVHKNVLKINYITIYFKNKK